jgi:hypothetical protein
MFSSMVIDPCMFSWKNKLGFLKTLSMLIVMAWLQLQKGNIKMHMTKLLSNIEKSRFQLLKTQSGIVTYRQLKWKNINT